MAGVARTSRYQPKKEKQVSEYELKLLNLIDELYTRYPFYGSRKMTRDIRDMGYQVNRKRVQRLMRKLGLVAMVPGPNTSKAHPQHKVYPYLLRGVQVDRPNQVWSTDITYIRLAHGFVYLVAIIDWYSRKVLSWRLSNTMDTGFCIDALQQAIQTYGKPEIFNSDQGAQFTSTDFTQLLRDHEILISMDGRGRALDNIFVERLWRSVKYEDVYLKRYERMPELWAGLNEYFSFYNEKRKHQSLDYLTPNEVHNKGIGGGAMIADYYGKSKVTDLKEETGQRCSAVEKETILNS
jgi:putative transposase